MQKETQMKASPLLVRDITKGITPWMLSREKCNAVFYIRKFNNIQSLLI